MQRKKEPLFGKQFKPALGITNKLAFKCLCGVVILSVLNLHHGHFGSLVNGEQRQPLRVPVHVGRLIAREVPQAVDQA